MEDLKLKINLLSFSDNDTYLMNLFRILLMMQVIFGHLFTIALPKFSEVIHGPFLGLWVLIPKFLFKFGAESAYLFIFLSGFLVGGSLIIEKEKSNNINVKKFFAKRVSKIYPPLIFSLFLTLFIDYIGQDVFGYLYAYDKFGPISNVSHYGSIVFIGNLFSLQPTLITTYGSNSPLWTLGFIIQYYLIGAVIIKCTDSKFIRFTFVSIVFLFMYFVNVEWALLFAVWFIGAWMRLYRFNFNMTKYKLILIIGVPVLFAIASFFRPIGSVFLSLFIGIVLCNVMYALTNIDRPENKYTLMASKLSNVSYPAYLIHLPIAFFIYNFLSWCGINGGFLFLCFMFVTIGVTAFIGSLIIKLQNINRNKL